MRLLTAIIAGLCCVLTATAQNTQGNGKIVKNKITVSQYDKISVTGPFEVILTSGQTGTISVEGNENLVNQLLIETVNGTLIISSNSKSLKQGKHSGKVSITVPVAILSEISLTGSGSVTGTHTLNTNVKASLNGSGSIKIYVDNISAEASVNGSGSISLKGKSENFKCRIVGSGSVKALDLKASNVEALVSGSGDVKVVSNKLLKGRINGSGSIAFSGNPPTTDLQRTGSGNYKLIE